MAHKTVSPKVVKKNVVVGKNRAQVEQQLDEARKCYHRGKESHSNGKYEASVEYLRKAVQLQELLLGKYHLDTIKSYWRLGKAFCSLSASSSTGPDQNQHQREKESESGNGNGNENYTTMAARTFLRSARMAESSLEESINAKLWKDIQQCWAEMKLKCELTDKESQPTAATEQERHSPSPEDDDEERDDNAKQQEKHKELEHMAAILRNERDGDAACKKRQLAKAVEHYRSALKEHDTLMSMTMSMAMTMATTSSGAKRTSAASSTDNGVYADTDFDPSTTSLDVADLQCKLASCLLRLKNKTSAPSTSLSAADGTRQLTNQEQALEFFQQAHACYLYYFGEEHPAVFGTTASINKIKKHAKSSSVSTQSTSGGTSGTSSIDDKERTGKTSESTSSSSSSPNNSPARQKSNGLVDTRFFFKTNKKKNWLSASLSSLGSTSKHSRP